MKNTNWRNWCKLCGSAEITTKLEQTSETEEIRGFLKYLQLPISKIKICKECNSFLNEINSFIVKSKSVENMFIELLNVDIVNSDSLDIIRCKFGLKELTEDDTEDHEFFDDLYEEPTVIIKQEKDEEFLFKLNEDVTDVTDVVSLTEIDEKTGEIRLRTKTPPIDDDDDDSDEVVSDENENESEDNLDDSDVKIKLEHSVKRNKQRTSTSGNEEYAKTDEEKLFDFTCHVCGKEFLKMRHLMAHCKEEHNCLAQVNCVCGKMLATWNRLLVHKRKHFPEKPNYECKECKLTYYKQSTFQAHMASKHGPDAKKFICSQCGKSFKAGNILRTHERTHLPDELKSTEQCHLCEKKFVNKNALNKHINSLHTKEILFTCEQCGKSFTSKGNLRSHLTSHLTERNFKCELCDMRFKSSADLRKHKRVHSEKSLECHICGAKFKMRPTLLAHMVIHSDEKKYKCTYCPNEYKRPQALKCHLSVHTGERPYQCPFCDRTFINGSNCRKHKLKDHPIELAAYEAVHGKGKVNLKV